MSDLKYGLELEQIGHYKEALKVYKSIDLKLLSKMEQTEVQRSIGACLFYIKNYNEALEQFQLILDKHEIPDHIKTDVMDCINICYLYSGAEKRSICYFKKKTEKELSDKSLFWANWYVAQGDQILKDFVKAELYYTKAYNIAKDSGADKSSFFLLYLITAKILNNKNYEANVLMRQYVEEYESESNNGLFTILDGILLLEKDYQIGFKEFNEGIKEAQEKNWIENVDLGNLLFNIVKDRDISR
ncbi:MAG: hypothetical protein PQJ46_07850 [Spirochaetales bacterium]|nr:hypothetical protein [Spirochaetales bacterium]